MSTTESEVREVEVIHNEESASPNVTIDRRVDRQLETVGAPPDANSLLANAMQIQGISLEERLMLMDKIESIFVARQQAEAEKAFFAALSAFQRECPVIPKTKPVYNKDGNKVRYYYAPLGDIVDQVGSLLASHGLSYDFSDSKVIPFEDQNGGPYMELTCNVHHSGGHSRPFPYRVVIEDNEYMSATQHGGEANSYARRYAFTNAFGILTGDNDFDGNPPERLTPAEARSKRQPVSQPQQKPTAKRAAEAKAAAPGERPQIQPAANIGEAIEPSTYKLLSKKLDGSDGGPSISDFKKRFPAFAEMEDPLKMVQPSAMNIILSFLADPANR